MNTSKLNYQLDDIKALLDELRDKNEVTKGDLARVATRYDRLYEVVKLQLAMIGTTWTVMLSDKNRFLTSIPGKFLSEEEAEMVAKHALDEQENGVTAKLYCDGVFIKEI